MFGSVKLPLGMAEDDLSTGTVDSSLVDAIGGAFDALGSRQRLPRRRTITHTGMYTGQKTYLVTHTGAHLVSHTGARLMVGDAKKVLRGQVDALRAKLGQVDSLWRLREDDGALQWVTARLLSVGYDQTVDAVQTAKLRSTFETLMVGWRSQAQQVASGSMAAVGTLLVHNGGDLPVEDALISVTATSTITSLSITTPSGVALAWTGSLAAGQTLTIDCGARTVKRGSVSLYSGFSLGGGHTVAGWLPLAVGDNFLKVTGTGAGTITVRWYNKFV